jgi:hypothetical protein
LDMMGVLGDGSVPDVSALLHTKPVSYLGGIFMQSLGSS